MLTVSVKTDIDRAVAAQMNDLQRRRVPRAAARALNKTARAAEKVADQKIRERFNVPSRVVKDRISIIPAGSSRLVAIIAADGSPIPLREYSARQTRKGVTYRVSKHVGRKLYLRKGQPAFILDRFGGHVFVRTGPDRDAKIVKVYGPSLPQVFVTRMVRAAMEHSIRTVWPHRFREELNYELNVRGA